MCFDCLIRTPLLQSICLSCKNDEEVYLNTLPIVFLMVISGILDVYNTSELRNLTIEEEWVDFSSSNVIK